MGKLIKRIPGLRLLISSLPGSALRTHVESQGKPDLVFSIYKLQNVKRIRTKAGSLCYSSCDEVLS